MSMCTKLWPGWERFERAALRSRGVRAGCNPVAGRPGLTLLELVVVLTILAALAGILVPMLPNMLRRSHKASEATQTNELAKVVQMYQASYYSYPDNFDLLTDASGAFPAYLPAETAGSPFGALVTASALTDAEVQALQNAGIKSVQPLASDADAKTVTNFHCTLNPYSTASATNSTPVSTSLKFAVVDTTSTALPNYLQVLRDNDSTARLIVLGVGARCSMVGQIMQDAPVAVPQKADFTPANRYSRFGVIFKVSGKEVQGSENRARFVAAVALEDDALEPTEEGVTGYYDVARDPRN